jgi:hypothetical protein
MSQDSVDTPNSDAPLSCIDPRLLEDLVYLVREESQKLGKLTRLADLAVDDERPTPALWESLIGEVLADPQCADIRLLKGTSGEAYLYSSAQISDGYARILLRLEENNPCELIAGTVREESETYPRPTPVALFQHDPFGMDAESIAQLVADMGSLDQYRDVRTLRASTGVLYLFSDRFLDPEWARSQVEWLEVGAGNSP